MTKDSVIKGHQILTKINMLQATIDANIKFFMGEHWDTNIQAEAVYRLPNELTPLIKELIKDKIVEYEKQLEELK